MCRVLKLSGRFRLRESVINKFIHLRVHAIQGSAEREGQEGVIAREHGYGRPEDPRLRLENNRATFQPYGVTK
jgi:hypothetical protein